MVKRQKKHSAKRGMNQGQNEGHSEPAKISPNTSYEYCSERLSPFGGLLALEKFMDAVKFREVFEGFYQSPGRTPDQGHYQTVYGILILLFIGFTRLWHFQYIQADPLVCALFGVSRLPHATTYWRYVSSLGINQGKSLLLVMAALRERVWQLCGITYPTIHVNIDTTVETLFGEQEGGRKGHNTKYRGKRGFRPVLAFIEETLECQTLECQVFYFGVPLRRCRMRFRAELHPLVWTARSRSQPVFPSSGKGQAQKWDVRVMYKKTGQPQTEELPC